jgi:hypothetical protein
MEDTTEGHVQRQERSERHTAGGWHILRFLSHLAAVYAIVNFCTARLSGWTRGEVLPLLQHPTSSGSFEFLFSHIVAFSFIPAFLAGLANARFKHQVAQFVWLVPALILAYKFATFPAPSVLQNQMSAAFHQYFGGGFLIPEFRDWHEFWSIVGSNPRHNPGWRPARLHRSVLCGRWI